MNEYKKHSLLLGGVLALVFFQALPELLQDRIDPYDASLFAANGGLFLSLVKELWSFASHPVDWLYSYYNQYPALAVRRHPPLFGFAEMLIYLFTGVSVLGAKLTAFVFAVLFATGVYALGFRVWRDALLAGSIAILVMATPQVVWLATAVRLDLPSMAFAIWALFHYVKYIRTNNRSSGVYFAILSVLSLYTYQLAFFMIASACLHLLYLKRNCLLTEKSVWLVFGILLACLIPLLAQQIYVAQDNFTAAFGGEIEEWKRFHPIQDRMSMEFFLYYPRIWLHHYPAQSMGVLVWVMFAVRRGIRQEEALLLLAALTALAFFTWGRGKDHRLAFYTMIPMAFLAGKGLYDLAVSLTNRVLATKANWVALGIVGAAGIAQSNIVPSPNYHLTGMAGPVKAIATSVSGARIFYSGPRVGAFVLFVRQYDLNRSARVFVATVQINSPEKLADFIRNNDINVLVWEGEDTRSDSRGYGSFRVELQRIVAQGGAFVRLGEFPLGYWKRGELEQSELFVVVRK